MSFRSFFFAISLLCPGCAYEGLELSAEDERWLASPYLQLEVTTKLGPRVGRVHRAE